MIRRGSCRLSSADRVRYRKTDRRGDNVIKKEMIAMLLAGGQGSRLGVLTQKVAKPAVSFGGKYRIIDFPLSNCINSGVDTVGVLTQYQPLRLNSHIGIGIPWDLDRNVGGVSVLPPYERSKGSDWYTGTANAVYQNLEYMEMYNPEYVLILSGDHIYKMDYEVMLEYHKANNADVTIAVMQVPWEEASRFGIMVADENNRITEFEEKPAHPKSNLASMGIYIFTWKALKEALIKLSDEPGCDFGKHVIPYCHDKGERIFAYEFNGYWKDVGTLQSYWEANMELIDIIPEFNLYEEYWKIYTKSDIIPPQYISDTAKIEKSIIGDGCEISGEVTSSVIGSGVTIGEGAVIHDSIIMKGSTIAPGAVIDKAIIAEDVTVGKNAHIGVGEYADSKYDQRVYHADLAVIGEKSVIPANVSIGRNTAISGVTEEADYPGMKLDSGDYIIKAGES
jgi:glucose-1-phosphate adenylyltransferase